MQRTRAWRAAAASLGLVALAATAVACGDDDGGDSGSGGGGSSGAALKVDVDKCTKPAAGTKVKLQLQWFTQAQFAGYFAAQEQGFYAAEGLEVEILEGGVDIQPAKVLADGGADFAVSWVPRALTVREGGGDVTNIAQVFSRSGTLQVSFKDKNITKPADFKGKKIGNWGFGNEYEIFAALTKANLDPAKDVTLVQQNFDMVGLLDGSIDAAEAMIYNEYAQVLESKNPATGQLYQPSDLNVVNYEQEGVGMLQDAVWADQSRLVDDPAYCGTAVAFLKASLQGWAYCSVNTVPCRDIVVAKGSKLGNSHQLWQMNEINGLIWPNEDGAGTIDKEAWDRTVKQASETKNLDGKTVLTQPVTDGAWTNDIVEEALKQLKDADVDVTGKNWKRIEVTLNEGGA